MSTGPVEFDLLSGYSPDFLVGPDHAELRIPRLDEGQTCTYRLNTSSDAPVAATACTDQMDNPMVSTESCDWASPRPMTD